MNQIGATPLHQLQAWQAAALLARREITAVDLVRACVDRISARDADVQAFIALNADAARAHARSSTPARCADCCMACLLA